MLNPEITHIKYSESHIKSVKSALRIILVGVVVLFILTLTEPNIGLKGKLFSFIWLLLMLLYCRIFNMTLRVNTPLLIGTDNILIYTNPLVRPLVLQWSDVKDLTLKKNIIYIFLNNGKRYKLAAKGLSLSPEEILLQMRTHLKQG